MRVNRRTIPAQDVDIVREASASPIMKVKCLAALAVPEDLIGSIVAIVRGIEMEARTGEAAETTITTSLQHSSTPASNGSKCKGSKRKFRAWEQCNKLQSLKATQHQSLPTQPILIIVLRRIGNTGNCGRIKVGLPAAINLKLLSSDLRRTRAARFGRKNSHSIYSSI